MAAIASPPGCEPAQAMRPNRLMTSMADASPTIPDRDGQKFVAGFARGLAVIEAFARSKNCKYVSGCGRRGWLRELAREGWREGFTIVRKELT